MINYSIRIKKNTQCEVFLIRNFLSGKLLGNRVVKFLILKLLLLSAVLLLFLNINLLVAKDSITVVIDNNYPPYSYINENGDLAGFSIDLWRKFEEKTGIKVTIIGKDWNIAQKEMEEGKYDIIDTLFKNPSREKIYVFTKPYEDVDTHIFYHKNITGIAENANLKGFQIATKKGGATAQFLKDNGFSNIKEYGSDEEMIKAASKGEVIAFAIGKNTGYYFLYKYKIQNDFKIVPKPLFSNKLHRAALKKNQNLINIINTGMEKISNKELEDLKDKWFGVYQLKQFNYKILIYAIILLAIGIFILFIINFFLNKVIKNRTKQLEMERIKFLSIFDNADHMIALLDKDGYVIEANKITLETMKISKDQINMMHLSKLPLFVHSKPLSEKMNLGIEYVNQNRHTAKTDITIIDAEGNEKSFSLSLTPILMDNDIRYIIAEGKDISEFIKMTKELEQYKASKNLEMLVSGLAHDFNNLLAGISNYLIIIKEKNKDPEIELLLERTLAAYKRAANLVKQILSFSKGIQLNYSDVDIADLIRQSLSLNTAGKNVKTNLIDNYNKNIKCDPNLISEVFDNIIINALQSTTDNGKIDILLEPYKIDDVDFVSIKIKDNGCGIPREKIDKIFQPLYTTKSKGSGLGLYMVKLIVEKHGGIIKVDSEEGKGTTFQVILPV
ncbi:multi-sensor signal transduction histidine kinase [Calditerrivibrio nitroreducens DSM 19672]|uniref:histidine kinase n=1 Tax=Calditerrivibrio nitroreducens (strain DSM 19672 / NBRC 101217 / Yu37-1) TaxID=768670 RepID=E4TI18_CALNY|nr:multi-sensor signal transduction histidine kinase [Calditerrivibrio nitroreducens DSM 19672]